MNTCRILVVEDEGIVAMDIRDRLAGMGYQLAGHASNGELALALAERLRPDLVLMDIRLQGAMDGITAAEQLYRRLHIPVIFLTAYSEDATLERARLAEPFGYILKPFHDRDLRSAIEIALYKHQAEEEIRRLNRLYDVLSQVNQAIVRIRTPEELLRTVCRLVVERGAIDLAWVGRLDKATSEIIPTARFGDCEEILSGAGFFADNSPEGQGSPGRAIREGLPFICNDCGSGDCLYPTERSPARFGLPSCGSFPLRFKGEVCGTLTLCAAERGFFREREIELLEEVALDISFALDKMDADTQSRLTEEALRESEERFSLAMEATSDGLWDWNVAAATVYYSPGYFRMLGYEPGELPYNIDTWVDLLHPEDREAALAANEACMRNQSPAVHTEFRMRSKDGSWRWIMGRGKATRRDAEGRVIRMIGTHVDITERKHAEKALRESEERLGLALAASHMGVWEWDLDTNSVFWSPQCREILGIKGPTGDLESLLAAIHPDDLDRVTRSVQEALDKRVVYNEEFRIIHSEGEVRWVSNLGRAEYANGSPSRLVCVL